MTFTLGRQAFPTGPFQPRWDGDTVSFGLDCYQSPVNVAASEHMLANLRAMANDLDDPVIPCTWSDDDSWDGFYRVTAVSVAGGPGRLHNGDYIAQVTMTRVSGGYDTSEREFLIHAIAPENDFAVTDALWPLMITPGAGPGLVSGGAPRFVPLGWEETNPRAVHSAFESSAVITSSFQWRDASSSPVAASARASLFLPPALAYFGACALEVQVDGVWRPVHGRQVPRDSFFRIHDGYTCFQWAGPTGSGSDALAGQIGHATASGWHTDSTITTGRITGGGWTSNSWFIRSVRPVILANSPDRVSVRITGGSADLTVTARRGGVGVDLVAAPGRLASTNALRLSEQSTAVLATSGNGNQCGVLSSTVQDTNDAQAFMIASKTTDFNLTEGAATAEHGEPILAGFYRDSFSSAGPDFSVEELTRAAMARVLTTSRVVAR